MPKSKEKSLVSPMAQFLMENPQKCQILHPLHCSFFPPEYPQVSYDFLEVSTQ